MAEALISVVLDQFASFIREEVDQELGLVVGVRKQVKDLTTLLTMLQAFLRDADVKQVKDEAVKVWLEELKDIAYDADDVLDEWRTRNLLSQLNPLATTMSKKITDYLFSPCSCFKPVVLRHQIGHEIKDIEERLNTISHAKDRLNLNASQIQQVRQVLPWRITSSLVDVTVIRGRDDDKKVIVNWLLGEKSPEEIHMAVPVLSIVGTGGFGKTTLAQMIFQQQKTKFQQAIWVCVSQPFDREKVAMEIIELATGNKATNFVGWEALHQQLSNSIKGKKFLLVLDDVWSKDPNDWTPLKLSLDGGAPGSRIIVTTRDEGVAMMMGSRTHTLAKLSDQDCWLLFQQLAFFRRSQQEREALEEIGKQISDKCKGVPLAAKTIGSLMRYKQAKMEWKNVLESDIWKMQEGEDGFLPSLLLSYDDLPSVLKQCFLYCAIFPKDEVMCKDELVKLWMAQGFLGLDGDKKLEMIGEQYFDDLAMRSLFQDFEKDKGSKIISCKMHDLVHDVVQFLTKTECAILVTNYTVPNNAKLRHINVGDAYPESASYFDIKKVRTLLGRQKFPFFGRREEPVTFRKLYCQLTCLRLLDLSSFDLKDLPDEVGRLLHLRYLKLSGRKLTKLPETMCDLYNLQTLILESCNGLSKLPEGFGRLLNLRHLECKYVDNLKYFPQGFGKFEHLRMLAIFCVSKASGGCKLEELRDLNLIGGELEIRGLDQVESIDEAKQAELQKKENLVSLKLNFGMDQRNTATVEGILEGLQPPCYLEKLKIHHYLGLAFPDWMLTLSNIVELELHGCRYCTLPALCKLTSLESLKIRDCDSIKQVGVEFLGISGQESHHQTAFPKLRELILDGLKEWEEWDLPLSLFSGQNKILPCLVRLEILDCQKLKALPAAIGKLPSLEYLWLVGVSWSKDVFGISEHCGFVSGESIPSSSVLLFPELTTLTLRSMDKWEEKEIQQITTASSTISPIIMPNLRNLSISKCPNLKVIPNYLLSPNLVKLSLYYLQLLESLKLMGDVGASSTISPIIMPNLRKLGIGSCPNLKVIPNYLLSPNLRKLIIEACPELIAGMEPYNLQLLESLFLSGDVGVFSRSLAPPLININTIQNLKDVSLWCSPHSSLPLGLNHLTSLQKLEIRGCSFMDFDPEKELSSEHFPNLRELKIGESHLSRIGDLCNLMIERCSRVNWSNLLHISTIEVDDKQIRG